MKTISELLSGTKILAGDRGPESLLSEILPGVFETFACAERIDFYYLPWPPSNNNMMVPYRGRKILSEEGRAFYSRCGLYITRQRIDAVLETIAGPAAVWIEFTPPSHRPDVHNYIKAILDVFEKARIVKNDRQIVLGGWSKREPAKPGAVNIFIAPISAND